MSVPAVAPEVLTSILNWVEHGFELLLASCAEAWPPTSFTREANLLKTHQASCVHADQTETEASAM